MSAWIFAPVTYNDVSGIWTQHNFSILETPFHHSSYLFSYQLSLHGQFQLPVYFLFFPLSFSVHLFFPFLRPIPPILAVSSYSRYFLRPLCYSTYYSNLELKHPQSNFLNKDFQVRHQLQAYKLRKCQSERSYANTISSKLFTNEVFPRILTSNFLRLRSPLSPFIPLYLSPCGSLKRVRE